MYAASLIASRTSPVTWSANRRTSSAVWNSQSTLPGDAVPRSPSFDEALVDEFADILADGLTRDADLGDLALADGGLALGDLHENPKPRRGSLVVEDVDHTTPSHQRRKVPRSWPPNAGSRRFETDRRDRSVGSIDRIPTYAFDRIFDPWPRTKLVAVVRNVMHLTEPANRYLRFQGRLTPRLPENGARRRLNKLIRVRHSLESMNDRYDVVIAGAGPAGAQCARDLAARGYDVVVLETESEEGSPPEQQIDRGTFPR